MPKKRRSKKQIAATKKMIAANKRRKGARKTGKRSAKKGKSLKILETIRNATVIIKK